MKGTARGYIWTNRMQKQLEKGFQKYKTDYLKIKNEFLPTVPPSKIRYKLSTLQYGNASIFNIGERLKLVESVLTDKTGITFDLVNELQHSYAATIALRALYIRWCRNQVLNGMTLKDAVELLKSKVASGIKRSELEKDLFLSLENKMLLLIKEHGLNAEQIHKGLDQQLSIQEIRAYLRKFQSSVKPKLISYQNELDFVKLLLNTRNLELVPKPSNISMTKYRRYMDIRSQKDSLLAVASELESKISIQSQNITKRGGWSPIPHFKKLELARKLYPNDLQSICSFFDNEFTIDFLKDKIKKQDEVQLKERLFQIECEKENPDWKKLSKEIGDTVWLSTRKARWNKNKKN